MYMYNNYACTCTWHSVSPSHAAYNIPCGHGIFDVNSASLNSSKYFKICDWYSGHLSLALGGGREGGEEREGEGGGKREWKVGGKGGGKGRRKEGGRREGRRGEKKGPKEGKW